MERVGIYNRCSTEEENQKNALATQAEESLELAKKMGWKVVGQYVEAQSGTSADNRKEYRKMLQGIEENKFDIIMIKSIDRLARNTKDWYLFLDCITRRGVRLYMYLEGKFYVSEDALITGIKAILAEQFSKELSQKIRNAHKRRQEKGLGYNITRTMYGWNKLGKDLYEVNEKEADYIRKALALAEQGYGYRRISNELYSQGARSSNQKRISETQWRNILNSPRIHGTMVLNKKAYDFEQKRKISVPEEQWIYVNQALPEIVSMDYHERVLAVLHKRSCDTAKHREKRRGRNSEQYKWSHKIFCGACGSVYYRTLRKLKGEKEVFWCCSKYIKMGKKKEDGSGCVNERLKEEHLNSLVTEEYWKRNKISYQNEVKIMEEFQRILTIAIEERGDKKGKALEKELRKIEEKENLLLQKLLDQIIDDELFSSCINQLKQDKQSIESEIETEKKLQKSEGDKEKRLNKICLFMENHKIWEKALMELAIEQVERINVQENQVLQICWKGRTDMDMITY